MNITSVFNYLDYYRDQQTVADPFVESTGTFRSGGQFDYRILNTLNYSRDDWSLGFRHRFLPSIENFAYATDPTTSIQGAGSYHMIDAFGRFVVSEKITVRGGIDNLFDLDPETNGYNPGVTSASSSTSPAYYDVIGRRYYVAFELNF